MPKRKKKVKKPTRQELEKKLDSAWSLAVRTRDKNCQRCGGFYVSAHHAFGRRHKATRWDLFNGISLCYPCHIHWAHRDPAGFTVWFEGKVGRAHYSRMAEEHLIPKKFTLEDLEIKLKALEEMVTVFEISQVAY
jgi:5-methylcytosine-specific restriction endonuclease McrA